MHYNNFSIGGLYSKNDISRILNIESIKKVREGIFSRLDLPSILLFVDLDKEQKDERFQFHDYFEGQLFHWDSQEKQKFTTPTIQTIVRNEKDILLFARVKSKIKGVTQPFVYCGRVVFNTHEPNSNNPVHIIFNSIDYDKQSKNQKLVELYTWKPIDAIVK